MQKAYFKEESRLGGVWIWVFIISGALPFVLGLSWMFYQKFYGNLNTDQLPDDKLLSILIILGAFILIGLVASFIFGPTLNLEIRDGAIHYKYRPFVWNWKTIQPSEISKWQIKKIFPNWYAGGWGYRNSIFKNRKSFITVGREGIEIIKKDGKQFFFTTAEKKLLEKAMIELTRQAKH